MSYTDSSRKRSVPDSVSPGSSTLWLPAALHLEIRRKASAAIGEPVAW